MSKTTTALLAAALAASAGSAFAQGHGGYHGGGHNWHDHGGVDWGFNFFIPVEPAYGPGPYAGPPARVVYRPARHIYYYYPWAHVYYAPWQDGYYYIRGNRWVFSHLQPTRVHGGGPAIRLNLAANSPLPYDAWVTRTYGG